MDGGRCEWLVVGAAVDFRNFKDICCSLQERDILRNVSLLRRNLSLLLDMVMDRARRTVAMQHGASCVYLQVARTRAHGAATGRPVDDVTDRPMTLDI